MSVMEKRRLTKIRAEDIGIGTDDLGALRYKVHFVDEDATPKQIEMEALLTGSAAADLCTRLWGESDFTIKQNHPEKWRVVEYLFLQQFFIMLSYRLAVGIYYQDMGTIEVNAPISIPHPFDEEELGYFDLSNVPFTWNCRYQKR